MELALEPMTVADGSMAARELERSLAVARSIALCGASEPELEEVAVGDVGLRSSLPGWRGSEEKGRF